MNIIEKLFEGAEAELFLLDDGTILKKWKLKTPSNALELKKRIKKEISFRKGLNSQLPSLETALLGFSFQEHYILLKRYSVVERTLTVLEQMGNVLILLHNASMVHGDPIFSNFVTSGNTFFPIDFTFSEVSCSKFSAYARDLEVFKKNFLFVSDSKTAFLKFLDKYKEKVTKSERILLAFKYLQKQKRYV